MALTRPVAVITEWNRTEPPTVGTRRNCHSPPMPATTPDTSWRVLGCDGSPKDSALRQAIGRAPW